MVKHGMTHIIRCRWTVLLGTLCIVAAGCEPAPNPASPYAGEQARPVKALSEQDVEGYLSGQGMGFAKPAELNHYPGPKHVLALADELELSEEQRTHTQALFEQMQAEAVEVGRQIVAGEGDLDALFAGQEADPQRMRALLDELGVLQARLRFIHLEAHLRMKRLLTEEQVRHYDQLRGYTGGASAPRHDPAMMQH
ncbi:MAG: Spy/CpxP family protein refolding chaperone [Rhodothermales bacterium]